LCLDVDGWYARIMMLDPIGGVAVTDTSPFSRTPADESFPLFSAKEI
jgi:hypothetical protein